MKKHKAESNCSGIRDKTAFVALSQFDEMALLSGEHLPVAPMPVCFFQASVTGYLLIQDYRFLEDTGRFAEGATRDSLVRTPRTTSKVSSRFGFSAVL